MDSDRLAAGMAGLSHQMLLAALRICACLPDVRREVVANHDDNRWWPLSVRDWRLRMVVAGWSARQRL